MDEEDSCIVILARFRHEAYEEEIEMLSANAGNIYKNEQDELPKKNPLMCQRLRTCVFAGGTFLTFPLKIFKLNPYCRFL